MLRFLLALALATATDPAADKVAWLKQNTVAFRTVDPQDHDFADLQPLKQSIGEARIVLLGELAPDDSTAKSKQRLVRFLHQEMGFDVLACDAPFFDVEEEDRGLEVPDLQIPGVDYVRSTRRTDHPLHVSGFGLGISPYMQREYTRQLFHFIDGIDRHLASPADRKALRILLTTKKRWQTRVPAGMAAIGRVYHNLGQLPASRELLFYRQTLANLSVWISGRMSGGLPSNQPNFLPWLAKEWNPDRKIIVWSTNAAIVRDLPNQRTAGTDLVQAFGKSVYAVAFDEINGENESVPGLESLLHATRRPNIFLDLRGLAADHWLREPVVGRLLGGAQVFAWPLHFDAIVSIEY